jgi:hypothetical protein
LLGLPDRCTSYRWLCRLAVRESPSVPSRTPSVDFSTPKSSQVPKLLCMLQYRSVRKFISRNHSARDSKRAPTHCSAVCEETASSVTRPGSRVRAAVAVETFSVYIRADWSLAFATRMLLGRPGSELLVTATNIILLRIFPLQNICKI